ncbi:MAG: putative Histidine kinase [Promethearchaeota archaeon]|nr:MAG: putative Histidine kinase [Candidatus Lokiarchaeota archaeon]
MTNPNNLLKKKPKKEKEEREEKKDAFWKSRHVYENVFNAIQDGISILDRNLNIIQVNHWMEKMYKIHHPLPGKKCYEVYQQRKWICPWCPSLPALRDGQLHTTIVPYPSKESPTGWIELTAYPIVDDKGKILGIIEHVKDITKQTLAAKKLKAELEKKDFYKDLLAHDMSNILHTIKASILLMEHYKDNSFSSESRTDIFQMIEQQIERGASLLSNVRKLSEIETIKENLSTLDLKKTLEITLAEMYSKVHKKELIISKDFPPETIYVKGGTLLADALENIILNGILHNENPTIQLWIKITPFQQSSQECLKLEIADNGIGISDERKTSIFSREYHTSKEKGGMGLGLLLAKKIIKAYGGQISVENHVPEDFTLGSNFVITLQKAK